MQTWSLYSAAKFTFWYLLPQLWRTNKIWMGKERTCIKDLIRMTIICAIHSHVDLIMPRCPARCTQVDFFFFLLLLMSYISLSLSTTGWINRSINAFNWFLFFTHNIQSLRNSLLLQATESPCPWAPHSYPLSGFPTLVSRCRSG